jgi:hypothetical protein
MDETMPIPVTTTRLIQASSAFDAFSSPEGRAHHGYPARLSPVIPGRPEAPNPESRKILSMVLWIPGSPLRGAPE